MPVRAAALGDALPPATVDVTVRMALAFAAGIGDVGPRTFDDAAADALVAPPSFCVRLEWAVLAAGRAKVLGVDDGERLRAVHVEQDSTFHRPIRPGDRLTTRARIVAARATSAGALVQTRLSTTASASNGPVVTSWHSAIYRGVALDGADGRVEQAPEHPSPPASLPNRVEIPIPREAAHVFTECAGIWNPIHSERRVALAAGLPDVVLHGSATWAFAGREIVGIYGGGDPTRLGRLRARFKAPVVPGGALTLFHRRANEDVFFRVVNAAGEDAVTEGYARLS
jgi:acyl dehydratase